MIIVTGATGQLGRAIVRALVQRRPSAEVGASARDVEKAADLAALGVRVRQADFESPASLSHAFEGASQVLLVSSNARAHGGDPLAQHRNAIEAARSAGAGRVLYTSHMAGSRTSAFPPMRDHAATEEMLASSGLAWTSLRNGFYAQSGLMMLGEALKTGELALPEEGKVSWTAHADLAEAAAAVLCEEGRFDGPTPPLTGSEALSLAELSTIAADLQRKPLRRVFLTDDQHRTKLAARGLPPAVAEIAMGFFVASRRGEFVAVDPTLEKLIGRPPVRMKDFVAQEIDR
ncbi:MAG: SDR family oxidoreductase [Polyangiaceae bacterium]|nr:SDR family oxidoreductase [Polyangiaceae bacterium]